MAKGKKIGREGKGRREKEEEEKEERKKEKLYCWILLLVVWAIFVRLQLFLSLLEYLSERRHINI